MATLDLALDLQPKLHGTYDRRVDVLYLALGEPVESEGLGTEKGLQLDFDTESGKPCGATIIGYRFNHWHTELSDLSRRIGLHLSTDPGIVAAVISNVLGE